MVSCSEWGESRLTERSKHMAEVGKHLQRLYDASRDREAVELVERQERLARELEERRSDGRRVTTDDVH